LELPDHVKLTGSQSDYCESLNRVGRAVLRLSSFESAIIVLDSLEAEGAPEQMILNAKLAIADTLITCGRVTEGTEVTQKVLKRLPANRPSIGYAMCLSKLGRISSMKGKYELAELQHHKALLIFNAAKMKEGIAVEHSHLATVYMKLRQGDKVIEHFKASIAINEELKRFEGLASNYSNLGVVLLMVREFDEAEQMLANALHYNQMIGRLFGVSHTLGQLGWLELERGDLNKAEALLNDSLEIATQIAVPEGIAFANMKLAELFIKTGNRAQAEVHAAEALSLYTTIGAKAEIEVVRKLLNK
jgi:tetratricopeptide (TPR) repeat protein